MVVENKWLEKIIKKHRIYDGSLSVIAFNYCLNFFDSEGFVEVFAIIDGSSTPVSLLSLEKKNIRLNKLDLSIVEQAKKNHVKDHVYNCSTESARLFLRALIESPKTLSKTSHSPYIINKKAIHIKAEVSDDGKLTFPIFNQSHIGKLTETVSPVFIKNNTIYPIHISNLNHFLALRDLEGASISQILNDESLLPEIKEIFSDVDFSALNHEKLLKINDFSSVHLTLIKDDVQSTKKPSFLRLAFRYGEVWITGEIKDSAYGLYEKKGVFTEVKYSEGEAKWRDQLAHHGFTSKQGSAEFKLSPITASEQESFIDKGFPIAQAWKDFLSDGVKELEKSGAVVEIDEERAPSFVLLNRLAVDTDSEKDSEVRSGIVFLNEDGSEVYPATQKLIDYYDKYKLDTSSLPESIFIRDRGESFFEIPKYIFSKGLEFVFISMDGNKEAKSRSNKIKTNIKAVARAMLTLPEGQKYLEQSNISPGVLNLFNVMTRKDFPLLDCPKGITCTPTQEQMEGFRMLHFLHSNKSGACLADHMGIGKSVQALMLMCQYHNENPDSEKPMLVVVVKSALSNWVNEIKQHTDGRLKPIVLNSNEKELARKSIGNTDSSQVYIMNYHALETHKDFIKNTEFKLMAYDESQAMKNPSTSLAKNALGVNVDHAIPVSGTPIENTLLDLWPQMELASKGLLPELPRFKKEYVNPLKKAQKENDELAAKEILLSLKLLIAPFVIRRGADVANKELPPLVIHKKGVPMKEEYKKEYEIIQENLKLDYERIEEAKANPSTDGAYLAHFSRMQNLALDAYITYKKGSDKGIGGATIKHEDRERYYPNLPISSKTELIVEDTKKMIEAGSKVVIFSRSIGYISVLKRLLKSAGHESATLTGEDNANVVGKTKDGMEITQSDHNLTLFKESKDINVILISIDAGAAALNITEATKVILCQPSWNPFLEEQAIKRCHRRGQKHQVDVYIYYHEDTIDEYIFEIQNNKKFISDYLLSDVSETSTSMIDNIVEMLNINYRSNESIEKISGMKTTRKVA